MTSTECLSSMLYERGIEYDDESYLGSVFWGNASYEQFGDGHTRLIVEDATPEQAIAATVGPMLDQDLQQALDFMRIWITDDAHLGESDISYELEKAEGLRNLEAIEQAIAATVGAEPWEPSKEWKAWHESLKHDNPTSIREAVENILYEAIDFGGDMGPNGNVWSGVDEGDVLTDGCINGWVKSIEEIAATVGTEPDEATMLKLHDRMNAALLDYESAMGIEGGNGANTVPLVIEMHQIIEDVAKAGAETCTMDGQYGNYRCSNCGQSWQLGCVRPKEQSWTYCPHCRARIIKEEAE